MDIPVNTDRRACCTAIFVKRVGRVGATIFGDAGTAKRQTENHPPP